MRIYRYNYCCWATVLLGASINRCCKNNTPYNKSSAGQAGPAIVIKVLFSMLKVVKRVFLYKL